MSGTETISGMVQFPMGDVKYQGDLNEEQRRVLRVMWLSKNIEKKNIETAITSKLIEPSSIEFIDQVRVVVEGIHNGEKDAKELTRLMQIRMEDIYRWSQPHSQFSPDEMKKIAAWCRRDGHVDMAKDIEDAIREREGSKI